MTPSLFLNTILMPGLTKFEALGGPLITPATAIILLAIALQESGLVSRYENHPANSPGPYRGFWMLDQIGAVTSILQHVTTKYLAKTLCQEYLIALRPAAIWRAIEGHDNLSVGFARLLLLTDGLPIPTNETDGWDSYRRNWRSRTYHPEWWTDSWAMASDAVNK